MRNQVHDVLDGRPDLAGLFDLKADGYRGETRLMNFELREEELFWWHLPRTSRISRSVTSGNVHQIFGGPLANPLELFRIIGSHALAARSLMYPMRAPAYWVRREEPDGSDRYFRPALPETQLAGLFGVPERQVRPALQPLLEDGAIELVRSPSGIRAVLMRDGFVDEGRLRTRLRA